MKRIVGVGFLWLVALVLPSFGEPSPARDLGEGLVYLRLLTESESVAREFVLPAIATHEVNEQSALVLDLRYVVGAEHEAGRLSQWLGERAATSSEMPPLFFLVNAETSPVLCEAVSHFSQNYPSLVIGPVDFRAFLPDIALAIDPEEERAAYIELASGEADIAALIGEDVEADKRRYDEAAVIAAHAAPEANAELSETHRRFRRSRSGAASSSENTEETGKAALARPIDLALQRAIHLYRAWRVFDQHPQL